LTEISVVEHCRDSEIRRRVLESPKSPITTHYVVMRADDEIAFLATDELPELETFVLYELFVPSGLRRSGVGRLFLKEVERIAMERGFGRIVLTPWPLDGDFPEELLEAWYRREGYEERVDCLGEFEKVLSRR